ncbi:hypothetical protein QE422_001474 [Chryseobacterium sp. SORGH_AS 447]|nr:hypothetical protein [Chryseobacterium sp. SORGH_AS_0447]MDQ1161106.1 hypothetical protein [Chryseobacterium sp. SORGH_AS_0447]
MDLKTLNRIDTLRRLRTRGPKTPEWLRPYHLLLLILIAIAIISLLIRIF